MHRYYTCVRRAKRGKDGCPSKGWPADALEAFVVDRIRSVTADGELAGDVAGRLTTRIAERRTTAMGRRRARNAAADRAEREVGRLVDSLADATAEHAPNAVLVGELDVAGATVVRLLTALAVDRPVDARTFAKRHRTAVAAATNPRR